MNNKIIAGIVAVVVIVGLGWFFLSKKGNDQYAPTSYTQNQTSVPTPSPTTHTSSLMDLMGQGNQSCTFSDAGSSGTVYISSGKTRMDISAVAAGVTSYMHNIRDGQTSYTWIDGQTTGFKSSATASTSTSTSPQSNQQVDPNKQLNYICSSGSVDGSKFVLPTNIQFMDLSSIKIPGR